VSGTAAALAYARAHRSRTLRTLEELVRIPSISAEPRHAGHVHRCATRLAALLRHIGLDRVRVVPTRRHPLVYGEWRRLPGRPTVLVYGHYDVQPPEPLAAWRTPPFEPVVQADRLYARGASDDKGPMLIPILVAEAFLAIRGRLPVNLEFLIEGEEECGSRNLEATAAALAEQLAADLVLSADGAMWRADLPSVIVASRGLLAFESR
jgi:acetylornithine deacetylase/succinyl-diaminopimelate desuccinylase-like protein